MNNMSERRTLPVSRESLSELRQQNQKFEQSCGNLNTREKELFHMIKEALRGKDSIRANMYANELARVRHLKRVFSQSQLALECISIRMESLLDLYEAIQLNPVSEAIRDVVSDIQGVSPEFAAGIEQITRLAGETLTQASVGFKEPLLDEAYGASPEGLAILKEVSKTIEDSLTEAFPEPPVTVVPVKATPQVEEITYGYEPTFAPGGTVGGESREAGGLEDFMKMLSNLGSNSRPKVEE